jgi:hypothetical protein
MENQGNNNNESLSSVELFELAKKEFNSGANSLSFLVNLAYKESQMLEGGAIDEDHPLSVILTIAQDEVDTISNQEMCDECKDIVHSIEGALILAQHYCSNLVEGLILNVSINNETLKNISNILVLAAIKVDALKEKLSSH